jgi:hypothetical protein
MESARECLQRAEQCERQAAEAQIESNRDALLAAAAMWRRLAVSPLNSVPGEAATAS